MANIPRGKRKIKQPAVPERWHGPLPDPRSHVHTLLGELDLEPGIYASELFLVVLRFVGAGGSVIVRTGEDKLGFIVRYLDKTDHFDFAKPLFNSTADEIIMLAAGKELLLAMRKVGYEPTTDQSRLNPPLPPAIREGRTDAPITWEGGNKFPDPDKEDVRNGDVWEDGNGMRWKFRDGVWQESNLTVPRTSSLSPLMINLARKIGKSSPAIDVTSPRHYWVRRKDPYPFAVYETDTSPAMMKEDDIWMDKRTGNGASIGRVSQGTHVWQMRGGRLHRVNVTIDWTMPDEQHVVVSLENGWLDNIQVQGGYSTNIVDWNI